MSIFDVLENNPTTNLTASFNIQKEKPAEPKKPKPEEKSKSDKEREKIITTIEKNIITARKQAEAISEEVHGNWTNKRQREADRRRNQKERLLMDIVALEKLLEMWKTDPSRLYYLSKVRSVKDIEFLRQHSKLRRPEPDWADWALKQNEEYIKKYARLGITIEEHSADAHEQVMELRKTIVTQEEKDALELRRRIEELRRENIPGFFPTPDHLGSRVIDLAKIDDYMSLLEPGAGIGSLVDLLKHKPYLDHLDIYCCEINHSLRRILELKKYNVINGDIMELQSGAFDRIIMNPPFEKGQDMDHVTHCFNNLLAPNGVLVSIVGAGAISGQTAKHIAFKELILQHGEVIPVETGAFKNAFNGTGISVAIVKLRS